MKRVGILGSAIGDPGNKIIESIVKWLNAASVVPVVDSRIKLDIRLKFKTEFFDDIARRTDFIVVLGGDGTMLKAARMAAKIGTPLLGINLGTLGFLTDVEKCDAITAIKKVMDDDFSIEKRMMLEVELNNQSHIALNDVAITRGFASRLIKLKIYVSGSFAESYRADGLVVATPTGSTAYNLSAGGPILTPGAQMIAITAICPHNLRARSFVVSNDDCLEVVCESDSVRSMVVSLDGGRGIIIDSGTKIKVTKSNYFTSIIKTTELSFFDILRKKML